MSALCRDSNENYLLHRAKANAALFNHDGGYSEACRDFQQAWYQNREYFKESAPVWQQSGQNQMPESPIAPGAVNSGGWADD